MADLFSSNGEDMTYEAAENTAEIAILVPLREEFRVFIQHVRGCGLSKTRLDGRVFFLFRWHGRTCVTAMVASAGENRAGLLALSFVRHFKVRHLIVVGIAGAIESDLRLGDVVIATAVDRYLENAKAEQDGDHFKIVTSGEPYRPQQHTLNSIQNFEFENENALRQWEDAGAAYVKEHASEFCGDPRLANAVPRLHDGHVASGSIVSGTSRFLQWLKAHRDRKYLAIEMESGGVAETFHVEGIQCEWTIVRGISDFGDEKKKNLDDGEKEGHWPPGFFRRYAMYNAVGLLEAFIAAGLFDLTAAAAGQDIAKEDVVPVPNVESLTTALDTLRVVFGFGWEQGSFEHRDEFAVYWPVTLREPTPIHAVQTFAAAVLQRFGGKIKLCLDDFGTTTTTVQTFRAAVERWMKKVHGNYRAIEVVTFSEVMKHETESWQILEQWLGRTNDRVRKILEVSKILETDSHDGAVASALSARKPRRLLTPATVWGVLASVLANELSASSVITLGGEDEKPLWKAWRNNILKEAEHVGHLYIPRLGESRAIHMADLKLGWDMKEHARDAILRSLEQPDALGKRSLLMWSLQGCHVLPQFIASGFKQLSSLPQLNSVEEARNHCDVHCDAISRWLF